MSIRWKMTLVYTGLLAVLIVAFGLFLFVEIEQLMINSMQTALSIRFHLVMHEALRFTNELEASSSGTRPARLPTLERFAGPGVFLQIADPNGHVVALSSNAGTNVFPLPAGHVSQERQGRSEIIRLPAAGLVPEAQGTDLTQARFLVQSSLLTDQKGHPLGVLEMAQSLFIIDQVEDQLIDVLAAGVSVAVGLAIGIGVVLAGRLLRPIVQMTQTAQCIGTSHDLSQRIVTSKRTAHDEVGRLAVTFNTMLARLEAAFVAQQQFVADASHELKTPLTAMLGHANIIRRHGHHRPDLVEEALGELIAQAERMQGLIEQLLQLAQTDTPREISQEMVSLDEIAQEVIAAFTPLIEDKAIHVTMPCQTEGAASVLGEREALKQVVINLMDNALKFTNAGGQVSIAIRQETCDQQQEAILEVRDSGCGIAPLDLPHIFERWYRVDKARTRATGGSGLGLSIVQVIIQRHGGKITVSSELGQGSVFWIRLPSVGET